MNKTTAFCKKHNIKITLEKKWYGNFFTFLYNRRMQKYHQQLILLRCNYERLENEVKKAIEYYTTHEVPKIASYTDERFEIEMPEIDFSDIKVASEQIDDSLEYFTKNVVWKEMFKVTNTVLYNARRNFILEAISKMPNDKNVVVIKSSYVPKEELQENFRKQCIGLSYNPGKCGISIKCVYSTEWVAFCPFHSIDRDIDYIIDEWVGNPVESTVSYL